MLFHLAALLKSVESDHTQEWENAMLNYTETHLLG